MKKSSKVVVKDIEINFISRDGSDYLSLTDMAKFKNPETTGIVIANWLSTKYTIQFMGAWERVHNPNFNVMEFNNIKIKPVQTHNPDFNVVEFDQFNIQPEYGRVS